MKYGALLFKCFNLVVSNNLIGRLIQKRACLTTLAKCKNYYTSALSLLSVSSDVVIRKNHCLVHGFPIDPAYPFNLHKIFPKLLVRNRIAVLPYVKSFRGHLGKPKFFRLIAKRI